MSILLTDLRARSLRGLPRGWRDVAIGPAGLLVCGENGVGKSSLIDALEYTLKGTTSLFPDARQGVTWDKACAHILDGAADLAVCVVHTGTKHELTASLAPAEIPAALQSWVEAARAGNFVLRRHMLLGFIGKAPKDRYLALEPFLKLDGYAEVETSIKGILDRLKTAVAAASTQLEQVNARLQTTLGGMASSLDDATVLARLNEALVATGLRACADEAEVRGRHSELTAQLTAGAAADRFAALVGLRSLLRDAASAPSLMPVVASLETALATLEGEATERLAEAQAELLERGQQVIAASTDDACPLCEQAIDRSQVLARLNERVTRDRRMIEARAVVRSRCGSVTEEVRALAISLGRLAREWDRFLGLPLPAPYREALSLLDRILSTLAGATTPSREAVTAWAAELTACPPNYDDLTTTLDTAIAAEGGERQASLTRLAVALHTVLTELPTRRTLWVKLGTLRQREAIASKLHGHAIDARKAAVQAVVSDIAGLAGEFYAKLHPDERIGNPKLMVRQAGQGSVELTTTFHDREGPPLLYLSESHLDTLGLCFFLAMRRREAERRPAFKLLLLDDVLHSVDAAHRGRFAELLRDAFADHQLVITTHDPLFYASLRRTLTGTFTQLMINGWDIRKGPMPGDSAGDLDVVISTPDGMTLEALAGAGGRICEWLLKVLAERLQVSVVARFASKHTIADLWPPVAKKLREHKGFLAAHPTLVESLDASYWVRNEAGAHHNESPAAPTRSEVEAFTQALARLHGATHCAGCRSSVAKRDNDHWACNCGELRYSRKAAVSQKAVEPV